MSKVRTDVHRPSEMNPADYVYIGASDQSEYWGETAYVAINHATLAAYGVHTGNTDAYSTTGVPFYDPADDGQPRYRCHHCGKHGTNIRYFIFFLHKPSEKVVVVGKICAKKLGLASKEELNLQKQAAAWRRANARDHWSEAHADVVDFLQEYSAQREAGGIFIEFYDSLARGLAKYKSLTDRQVISLRQSMGSRPKPWAVNGDRNQGHVTQDDAEPTEAQLDLIQTLREQLGKSDSKPLSEISTRGQASSLINYLKGLLGAPAATEAQLSYINRLLEEREMSVAKRRATRVQFDAGLTKAQASRWIERLLTLPKIEELV